MTNIEAASVHHLLHRSLQKKIQGCFPSFRRAFSPVLLKLFTPQPTAKDHVIMTSISSQPKVEGKIHFEEPQNLNVTTNGEPEKESGADLDAEQSVEDDEHDIAEGGVCGS